MEMRTSNSCHTIYTVLTVIALVMTGCHTNANTHETEGTYDYVSPPIPAFVQHLLDSATWEADAICMVDGKVSILPMVTTIGHTSSTTTKKPRKKLACSHTQHGESGIALLPFYKT